MSRNGFRFKLQRVLELRQRLEQESATRLSAARHEADQAQTAMKELEAARDRGMAEAGRTSTGHSAAGELQQIALMIAQLDEHLVAAETAHRAADTKVDELVQEFERAFMQRQIMNRLHDRHLADWQETEKKSDQATMDAVALSRHTRRKVDQETA